MDKMVKPVKHILLSSKDKQYLNIRKQEGKSDTLEEQPQNYKKKVVIKPWGYEFLMFENNSVAIWFLHINKDHSTSMHCHPLKKTSLTLLSGQALCNTFRHRNFLIAGDALVIDPAVFHSTKALSLDGISLIEVETPPAKLDLVRLEDNYGRKNYGYEGFSKMITDNLETFNYLYFEENSCSKQKVVVNNKYSISMETYSDDQTFQQLFSIDPGALYCVCKGDLLKSDNSKVVATGETERGGYLRQINGLSINSMTVLMKFSIFE